MHRLIYLTDKQTSPSTFQAKKYSVLILLFIICRSLICLIIVTLLGHRKMAGPDRIKFLSRKCFWERTVE
jgi:hypothetical protein